MTLWTLAARSLRYHWRLSLAVTLGVAVATAVITGALVVGDSVRGSMQRLVVERLGAIDQVLIAPRFFRQELAGELAAAPGFSEFFTAAVPIILAEASCESVDDRRRAGGVTVVGCDDRFWQLGDGPRPGALDEGEVVVSRPLAEVLRVGPGDELILRLGRPGEIPADSPLGRRSETTRSVRLVVADVLPARGLGRFGLRASQLEPRNLFLNRQALAEVLDKPGSANAVLIAAREADRPAPVAADAVLQAGLVPTLADYGLRLAPAPGGGWELTSDAMVLDPAVVEAARHSPDDRPRGVFTYLANAIAVGQREIPYSTITALDLATEPPLGPLIDLDGRPFEPLADDEIVLNRWAAEQLGLPLVARFDPAAAPLVRVTYFEPESIHGNVVEATHAFRLRGIAGMEGAALDRSLTPELKGVTDQQSIANWNPPFPFHAERIRKQDEDYWDQYRATPKAFVSLAAGQPLWRSRFGELTALRWPRGERLATSGDVERRLHLRPADLGFEWLRVKRLGLQAAEGTTPFEGLFLGFSMFLIAAAALLVALLFRLGIDARASQIGILLASGLGVRRVRTLLVAEAGLETLLGGVLGAAAGVGYAALMLVGLQTIWLAAISAPFLRLAATPRALGLGAASGAVVALATIWLSLARLGKIPARQLLAGRATMEGLPGRPPRRRHWRWRAALLLLWPVAAALVAPHWERQTAAAWFFAAGAVTLGIGLFAFSGLLHAETGRRTLAAHRMPLVRLAGRNAGRNRGRTLLSVALIASAVFVIVAISAFRLEPQSEPRRESGAGGYSLWAQSDLPIHYDLGTAEGQAELGFLPREIERLAEVAIVPLRVQAGDDASCLNLYRPRQPRLVGVSRRFVERGGFRFSAARNADELAGRNAWRLLGEPLPPAADGTPRVGAIVDQNTLQYSLHLGGLGASLRIADARGKPLELVVVAILAGSIFQGDLLIAEAELMRYFPSVSGDRLFLIDCPPAQADDLAALVERRLGDYGFDAEPAALRLAQFFAVQNTYLSTFQVLGALGLLLGTLGLAVVELRNVLERTGELALLRAVGFRSAALVRLVTWENVLVLLAGMALGCLAALVAVMPHLGTRGAIPWGTLATMLGLVVLVGIGAGRWASHWALRRPLLAALAGQ